MHLQRVDPAQGVNRWYVVTIQPTLFAPWAVVCFWGSRAHAYQRMRVIPCANRDDAERRAKMIVRAKVKKGYQVRPSQCVESQKGER